MRSIRGSLLFGWDEAGSWESVLTNPEPSKGGPAALSVSGGSSPYVTSCILCDGCSGWSCIGSVKIMRPVDVESDGGTHNRLVALLRISNTMWESRS